MVRALCSLYCFPETKWKVFGAMKEPSTYLHLYKDKEWSMLHSVTFSSPYLKPKDRYSKITRQIPKCFCVMRICTLVSSIQVAYPCSIIFGIVSSIKNESGILQATSTFQFSFMHQFFFEQPEWIYSWCRHVFQTLNGNDSVVFSVHNYLLLYHDHCSHGHPCR